MKALKRFAVILAICTFSACVLMGCRGEDSSDTAQPAEHSHDVSVTESTDTTAETTVTTDATTTTEITTTTTSNTTTEHSETETTTSQSAVAASGFIGAWDCTGVEQNGVTMTLAECFRVEEEVSIALIVSADGTFSITLSLDGVPVCGTWVETDGAAVFTAMELPINGVVADGRLTLYEDDEKMFFVKSRLHLTQMK